MRPNPDIPVDWNILIFPINPRYTKQGVLDGKVGLRADVDYPQASSRAPMRATSSRSRPTQLKSRIDREEQELHDVLRAVRRRPERG